MSYWRLLLKRTISGLSKLQQLGQPVPSWVLGGGTALMVHTNHRLSKDVDAFIDDPQYLSYISPRLVSENIWSCDAYDETAHYLKLVYPEGEIDFIVASKFTSIPDLAKTIDGDTVSIEHPVEIAIKKLHYRGPQLKVRDIFDIAVVDRFASELLAMNLPLIAGKKVSILTRLAAIKPGYAKAELTELAIQEPWRELADTCLQRVKHLIEEIPDPLPHP